MPCYAVLCRVILLPCSADNSASAAAVTNMAFGAANSFNALELLDFPDNHGYSDSLRFVCVYCVLLCFVFPFAHCLCLFSVLCLFCVCFLSVLCRLSVPLPVRIGIGIGMCATCDTQ